MVIYEKRLIKIMFSIVINNDLWLYCVKYVIKHMVKKENKMTTITKKESTQGFALMITYLPPRARTKTKSFTLSGATVEEAKEKLKIFLKNHERFKNITKIKESPAKIEEYGMVIMNFYDDNRRAWNNEELEAFLKEVE